LIQNPTPHEVASDRSFRGGRVLTVTGVPSQPNTYYFGAVAGGVWKTTDAGVSWDPLFDKQTTSFSPTLVQVFRRHSNDRRVAERDISADGKLHQFPRK